uniref:MYB protein n=1 Tax=Zingiber officinale TaxID=94328 RepID=A0AA50CA35_ZINOF|nr:MYB protein [Zingiber officinale]
MGDGGAMAIEVMKIEQSCVENKQPGAASSSSMSEGSYGFSGMSPSVCSSSRSSPSHRRTSGPIRRAKGGWTPQEDETLRRAVEIYKGRCWKKIEAPYLRVFILAKKLLALGASFARSFSLQDFILAESPSLQVFTLPSYT